MSKQGSATRIHLLSNTAKDGRISVDNAEETPMYLQVNFDYPNMSPAMMAANNLAE